MTTPETARCLALIAAAQARIAGMTAENMQRAVVGASVAYDAHDFFHESTCLEQLAQDVATQ